MGLFSFGGSSSRSSSNSASNTFVDPTQQPYLSDLRSQAQQLNAQGMPVEGVAGISPNLSATLSSGRQLGNMQMGAGSGLMAQGSAATAGTGSAMNFANNAIGGTAQGGINTAMGAGNQYAGGAANMNAATNSGVNMNNVNSMINNDILRGQIDAASRDVMRNLTENNLVNLASSAAGSGNSGSSRAQRAADKFVRDAGESVGDIASTMRGQAFNTALNIGANQASQNAGFQQQANLNNQNAFNTSRQFGTSMGQNAFNTNLQNQQFGARMNQQIGQSGVQNMLSGQQMANTGLNVAQGADQYLRDYDQQLLNNQYQQAMSPYNSLNFYNQIVGAPNNLSQATSSSRGRSRSANFGFG